MGETHKATEYLQQSLKGGERGYMVDVARVYLADRFPPPADSPAEPPLSNPLSIAPKISIRALGLELTSVFVRNSSN
ncbi:MAG: hypothetical protein R3C56_25585 [Pirellulaceae bacterium]